VIVLPLLTLLAIAAGVLALIDGVIRVRGRGTAILAVIEIIVAALFLIVLIPQLSAILPVGITATVLGIALLIVLVVQLLLGGKVRRGSVPVTIIAIVALAIWLIVSFGWIQITVG
jgi:hypothetical protein